jgi:hypothetical protein
VRPEGHYSVPNVLNIFNTEPYDKGVVWESCSILRKGGAEMRTIKYMDEEAVIEKAVKILMKELGPVETIRFINLPKRKRLESVRRHREWQKLLDKDRFFNEVFAKNGRSRANQRAQIIRDVR